MPPASPPCDPPVPVTLDADGNLPCPAGRPTKTWVLLIVGAAAVVVVGAAVTGAWKAAGVQVEAHAAAQEQTKQAQASVDAAQDVRAALLEQQVLRQERAITRTDENVQTLADAMKTYFTDIEAKEAAARLNAIKREGKDGGR